MRKIGIPKAIAISDVVTGKSTGVVLTFRDWLLEAVLCDNKFGKTSADLFRAMEVMKAVEDATKNGVAYMTVGESHWQKMVEIVNEPSGGWVPRAMLLCAPFFRAVLDARGDDALELAQPKELTS